MLSANDSKINPINDNITPRPIDWELCLRLANNKADLADEMLAIFTKELSTTHEHIRSTFASKNYDKLHQYVHKLHGATCYCGLPKLKAIVANAETSLKTQQYEALDKQIHDLLAELKRIQAEYEADSYKE